MRSILFRCTACAKHLCADETSVGDDVACAHCNTQIRVPIAAVEIACPGCRELVMVSQDVGGEIFHCPSCRSEIVVPTTLPNSGKQPSLKLAASDTRHPGERATQSRTASKGIKSWFGKMQWCVRNCLTGESYLIDKFPFEIGASSAVDLRLDGVCEHHCALIQTKGSKICLVTRDEFAAIFLNAEKAPSLSPLVANKDYSFQLGSHFFALRGGRNVEAWNREIDATHWFLDDSQTATNNGPLPLAAIPEFLASANCDPDTTLIRPKGLSTGFYLSQFSEVFRKMAQQNLKPSLMIDPTEPAVGKSPAVNSEHGELTCPVCWLKFDKGEHMHIAVHGNLHGDPVLGEDAMLRFSASRFNNQGQALDSMGVPCMDIACPHCRRKLPPSFMDVPHLIFSIVGAPSAGKSYYLSVLAKILPDVLYGRFGVVFKDDDPTGNAALNKMKNRLFTGATPKEVYLDKTDLDGIMYERIKRQGREVAMPKPFIFAVAQNDGAKRHSLVFYDNAGEHFEPGINELGSPGAQHVATAATILFLFDPTVNRHFRKRLSDHPDPQLRSINQVDQQETLLAEMEVRIKRLLHLDSHTRIDTPLAMMIGKCDVWLHLLGERQLLPVISDSQLDLQAIAANSQIIRQLLKELCPSIVANAESLASEVVYFPVSAFGHSPVEFEGDKKAPDPNKLNPMFVETPILWALSKKIPALFATRAG